MNEYTVDLRIEGESLAPDQVTRDLALEPSQVRRKGERRGGFESAKSMWAFGGHERGREWPSIEDGLRQLLDELAPVRSALEPYFQTCSVYWWCGSFQSEFGRAISLSPELFKRLAAFGAPVRLSSYLSHEPGD